VTIAGRARILKGQRGAPHALPPVEPGTTRRIAREVVEASLLAKRILGEARAEAAEMLLRARDEAAYAKAEAANEARENEVAKLAAGFLALRDADERRAERDLDRAVALACVLAERLLGEALDSDPLRILALARQALLEARGAHRAVIEASPLDVETLRSHVLHLGSAEGSLKIIEIRADPLLSRGSLRIHTNLGNLDAQLTPQLERLAKALRDALA
jgi:flagellar biosynthesis/type III secretory pathway protein FliH